MKEYVGNTMGTRNKVFINPYIAYRIQDKYRYFGEVATRSRNGDEECSRIVQNANKLFNFRESNIRVRLLAFSKKREYKWTGSTSRKVYKVKLSRVFLGRTNFKSFYSSDVGDNIQLFLFFVDLGNNL